MDYNDKMKAKILEILPFLRRDIDKVKWPFEEALDEWVSSRAAKLEAEYVSKKEEADRLMKEAHLAKFEADAYRHAGKRYISWRTKKPPQDDVQRKEIAAAEEAQRKSAHARVAVARAERALKNGIGKATPRDADNAINLKMVRKLIERGMLGENADALARAMISKGEFDLERLIEMCRGG
jgi:hypothetical protein